MPNLKRDVEGPESIQHLKDRFKSQLLMPLKSFEDDGLTASVANAKQYEDQLSSTGFCVPEKLRRASELPLHIDELLNEVQNIYFPGVVDITTPEEHQAFLLLSYVHIILFICYRMKINILEALCKDDKDRGNVIKTLLKLHFLYLTGQITKETLTQVLVHALARPFIMQKNGIIKSRLVLLEQAIPFLVKAYSKVPNPNTSIFGGAVKNASYVVASPKGQTLSPAKKSAKNIEEYKAFLDNHTPLHLPPFEGNLIKELSLQFYQDGQLQHERIQQKISASAKTLKIIVQDQILISDDEDYYIIGAHTDLLNNLMARLPEDDAWIVSCCVHEGVGEKLQAHLKEIFGHHRLGISVERDPKTALTIRVDGNRLDFETHFHIIDSDGTPIGKIKASIVISDYHTGKAQFKYSLV